MNFTFKTGAHGFEILADGSSFFRVPESECRFDVSFMELENELRVYIDGEGECERFAFPAAVEARADDVLLIPFNAGFRLRADDTTLEFPRVIAANGPLSMAFYGILRGGNYLLCAILTNLDAQLILERREGSLTPQFAHLPEKGRLGYRRELRYLVGEGGVSELCAAYREIAVEKGLVRSFAEREKVVPDVARLVGAANVWLWNSDAMDKLYDEKFPYSRPSPEQVERRLEIAREMKSLGMERVLWSIFDESVENREVDSVKSLGYLTSFYDVYTDVIPHDVEHLIPDTRLERAKNRRDCWPEGILTLADGSLARAWQLKGKDGEFHSQNRLCDEAILECASRVIPAHTREHRLDGRFIDVQCQQFNECYSEKHPMTRRTCREFKWRLFEMMRREGLFTGTEVGCEDVAAYIDYSEGMISPTFARQYDAGRRMTHVYRGDEIDPKIREVALNPKYRTPLWELVYHGCVQSYWYWGDSGACMPELTRRRDAFCRLWGEPELYSLSETRWEELREVILESYRRTTPLATELGHRRMLRFDVLDEDGLVQMTTFEGGIRVAANFSGEAITVEGQTVEPDEAVVIGAR